MRTRGWLLLIWVCFLLRGCFYACMLPVWEGYDEFAHFGVIRAAALHGVLLAPRGQRGPRDVEESLDLVPIPWGVHTWEVFHSGVTQEQFWSLPEAERRDRDIRLHAIPRAWQWQESNRISAYEAYQPPLYYWLMAPVLFVLKGSSLLAQALVLRCISVAIASAAIPSAFAASLAVAPRKSVALGCAALISVMPEFAISAARISNESVAILLFSLLVCIGLRLLVRNPDLPTALLLGTVLGLGLLTKAYFLAAVPPVFLLLICRFRRTWKPIVTSAAIAAALSGWWYIRNEVNTGTLTGLAEPVALNGRSLSSLVDATRHVPWLHGIDVTLLSHLYFCGWSGLTLRSWMYHVFFVMAILAVVGVIIHLRRPSVLWLTGIYGFFWIGELYNIWLQYLTKILSGSMGWYMYAVIVPEIVLCALAAPARLRAWAVSAAAILFATVDLYAMHCVAIPYYTGLIAHRADSDALAAVHLGAYRTLGFGVIFDRLAVNKWTPITSGVLIAQWILYLAATILLGAISVGLARKRENGDEPGAG
jgi:4-amino-4-deoxy-L-arabinose transferase-like glycosyltransferase